MITLDYTGALFLSLFRVKAEALRFGTRPLTPHNASAPDAIRFGSRPLLSHHDMTDASSHHHADAVRRRRWISMRWQPDVPMCFLHANGEYHYLGVKTNQLIGLLQASRDALAPHVQRGHATSAASNRTAKRPYGYLSGSDAEAVAMRAAAKWLCTESPPAGRAPPVLLLQQDRTHQCWPMLGADYACVAAPDTRMTCWVDAEIAMVACQRDEACVGVVSRGDGKATLKREHAFAQLEGHKVSSTVRACVQLARSLRCGLTRYENCCDVESATNWGMLGCAHINSEGVVQRKKPGWPIAAASKTGTSPSAQTYIINWAKDRGTWRSWFMASALPFLMGVGLALAGLLAALYVYRRCVDGTEDEGEY
jgi:hypothetical protein